MKKRIVIIASILLMAVTTGSARADIADFWPDWTWSSNSLYVDWDYWQSSGNSDGWFPWDFNYDTLNSPYYQDYAGGSLDVLPGDTFEGRDEVVQVNNIGAGGLVFYLDNYDTANEEKWVRVIVNYRIVDDEGYETGLTVGGFNVWTELEEGSEFWENDPDYMIDAGDPAEYLDQGDGWAVAAYDFFLEPNPNEEWIEIIFGYKSDPYFFIADDGEVFIDEVQINTRCVPIPAAAWLFGSVVLGVVGVRRKRQ